MRRKLFLHSCHEQTNSFATSMYTQQYVDIGGMGNEINK